MTRLSIHLLGPFHVTLDGEPVTGFESNKVRALLSFLALETGRPNTRDALIGLLWPDQPERAARRNLSQALFNLRQAIHDDEAAPPFLRITGEAVQFNLDSDHWLDVAAFAEHIAAVERHAHLDIKICETCIRQLDQADALYHGEFLAGFFVSDSVSFSDWATLWRERFHHQALDAQQRLAEHYEQCRDYEGARHYAWRQVELEPWREEAHQQLMRLLARSGQRSAALQQYETCRRVLADELGIEPSEDTKRLYRHIKSVPEIGAHNLPPQATRFVGRKIELCQLAKRLADPCCRLLTLVGPGGIGKTRLAVQVAHQNRAAFLNGVCFVSLASLQSAEFLVLAIADALHIHGQSDPQQQLLDALRGCEMLLVLDNFEQLIEDGADLLINMLQAAPDLKLLVTSRERLNLYGETVFDVGGMELSDDTVERAVDCSAVELFSQSADRARAGFTASAELAEVVRICRLVDGMPLGIELAAVWVRTLSCQQIAAEIERSLAFLSASLRGIPSRHRSVQAAFDHSWEHLPVEERRVFGQLSVFRGGFDREAALQVAGATLSTLSTLVDKSFLKEAQTGRYLFHELMRQYAAEKLAQDSQAAQTAQNEHCRYYTSLVSGACERFLAGQQRAALDTMAAELDNVRAAWQWSIDQERHDRLAQLMEGLFVFCSNRGLHEGDLLFGKAVAAMEGVAARQLEADSETHHLPGKLLWRWGHFVRVAYSTDDKTEILLRRSVACLRSCHDQAELAQALFGLGRFLAAAGRFTEARQSLEESIEIGRQLPDPRYLAQSLTGLGAIARSPAEIPCARQLIQEGLAIFHRLNDLRGMANSLSALSSAAYYAGDQIEARRLCLEVKVLLEELGDEEGATVAISNAGHVCMELGEYGTSAQYLREALQRSIAQRQTRFTLNVLHGLAELAKKLGRYIQAYELAIFMSCTPVMYLDMVQDIQHLLAELETRLPPEVTAAARARTATWTLDDAVMEALAMFEENRIQPAEA